MTTPTGAPQFVFALYLHSWLNIALWPFLVRSGWREVCFFVGRVGPKQTHRCELAISEVGRPVADMRSEAPNVQLLLQMDP
jgi:hypothetical protein